MLSFVLASLHILAYITCVWQQAECCLLSEGGPCFPCALAACHARFKVPNNWLIAIQVHGESCNSRRFSQITNNHIFTPYPPPQCHLVMQIVWGYLPGFPGRSQLRRSRFSFNIQNKNNTQHVSYQNHETMKHATGIHWATTEGVMMSQASWSNRLNLGHHIWISSIPERPNMSSCFFPALKITNWLLHIS